MAKKDYNETANGSAYESSNQGGTGHRAAARDKVSNLGSSASQKIEESPLIALGAGVALGAVLGAVLPVSRKEKELLQPIGSKLHDAGLGAVDRAKDMGKQKFDEVAGDTVRNFLSTSTSSRGSSANAS